jgi:hypothetical protein
VPSSEPASTAKVPPSSSARSRMELIPTPALRPSGIPVPSSTISSSSVLDASSRERLERVMNSIRNGLGMRRTEIVRQPSRPWNPHFYAIFAEVHNTL